MYLYRYCMMLLYLPSSFNLPAWIPSFPLFFVLFANSPSCQAKNLIIETPGKKILDVVAKCETFYADTYLRYIRYKTERPFRVDVHRNSLFLSSGEGRGWCLCCADPWILSGKVYIHHTTYVSHTCNFPCLEVDSFLFWGTVLCTRYYTILYA